MGIALKSDVFKGAAIDNIKPNQKLADELMELEKFLEQPQSIGLTNLKGNLKDMVRYMLALIGQDAGYGELAHVLCEEASPLAQEGILKNDKKKKKFLQDLLDEMERIAQEMRDQFDALFAYTENLFDKIEYQVAQELALIDAQIESAAKTEEQAAEIKARSSKRKMLKSFKKHIKQHKAELLEVEDARDIIEVQKDIIEDLADVKNGKFVPEPPKKDAFKAIDSAITNVVSNTAVATGVVTGTTFGQQRRAHNKHLIDDFDYSEEDYILYGDSSSSSSSSGSGDTGDSSGDSAGGNGDQQEQAPPPLDI